MAWHAGMPFIFDWHGMACFGLTGGGVPWHAGMFWVDGEWHGMAWHVLG